MTAWRAIDARFAALAAALLLYGIAGSPTPDNPGILEAAIGLLLILSVSLPASGPRLAFLPLLAFGMTVPLAAGCYIGYAPPAILRDGWLMGKFQGEKAATAPIGCCRTM